jgi:hypothetical protein
MFDNGLNRDTVYYMGLSDDGWQTTERVCVRINQEGLAITLTQTESLLFSLVGKGKVDQDFITLAAGEQYNIWKKKR